MKLHLIIFDEASIDLQDALKGIPGVTFRSKALAIIPNQVIALVTLPEGEFRSWKEEHLAPLKGLYEGGWCGTLNPDDYDKVSY